MNNHIVSRCLTRPWEHSQRQLWFFDFQTNKFAKRSSKSLFAKEDVLTDDEEKALRSLMETPYSQFRERLEGGDASEITQEEHLALYLMVLLGSSRYAIANIPGFGEGRPSFAELSKCTKDQLFAFYQKIRDSFSLVPLSVPSGHRLFVPETGIFPIPTFAVHPLYATALPITPRHLVVLCLPLSVDAISKGYKRKEHYLPQYSVGLGPPVSKVVVAPELIDQLSEEELRCHILNFRNGNQGLKHAMEWLLGV